jgi:hypothetical protein
LNIAASVLKYYALTNLVLILMEPLLTMEFLLLLMMASSIFSTMAVPILKKYGAPATVYITSDWTNEGIEPAIFSLEYHLYYQLPAKLMSSERKDFLFEKQVNNKNESKCCAQ